MDPISLGIQAVGLGMQIYGSFSQSKNAKQVAAVSKGIAQQEQNINDAKMRQMELEGRRMQMENLRNAQRARATAVQAATTQGAQFGTGLAGGLAQVQDKAAFNMLGVEQGLATGREINSYNQKISQGKMQLAELGASSAKAQGWSSLGGALLKAGPTIGAVSQGFGSNQTMTNPYNSMPMAGRDF